MSHFGTPSVTFWHTDELVIKWTSQTSFKSSISGVQFHAAVRIKSVKTMALEKEYATYKSKLPELKVHEGKWVLIQGDAVVDIYSRYDYAMKEGYSKFGLNTPFLVKQIHALEQVQFVSRFVDPVRRAS